MGNCDLISLKRDEVFDFTQFQRDKPQIFKSSRKTDYNEQGDRIFYCIASHSCDYIWWFFSRLLIALHCDSQDTRNLLFSRLRASK